METYSTLWLYVLSFPERCFRDFWWKFVRQESLVIVLRENSLIHTFRASEENDCCQSYARSNFKAPKVKLSRFKARFAKKLNEFLLETTSKVSQNMEAIKSPNELEVWYVQTQSDTFSILFKLQNIFSSLAPFSGLRLRKTGESINSKNATSEK